MICVRSKGVSEVIPSAFASCFIFLGKRDEWYEHTSRRQNHFLPIQLFFWIGNKRAVSDHTQMKKVIFPPIGNRILKSAAGVFLCECVYFLRGRSVIPFYSMIAVLWCIQPYTEGTLKMAYQRIVGTLVGALYGLITIILELYHLWIFCEMFHMAIAISYPRWYNKILNKKGNGAFSSRESAVFYL